MRAAGLAVPARHPRQAMGDIFDFDVERRGVEQIEAASREHALPGARGRNCADRWLRGFCVFGHVAFDNLGIQAPESFSKANYNMSFPPCGGGKGVAAWKC